MKRVVSIVCVMVVLVGVVALVGCDRDDSPAAVAPARSPATAASTAVSSNVPRVVFLGDSLTAGMGVDVDQAFPAVVGRKLEEQGLAVRVVNAGVSGDTTAGGLRRLDWILRQKPDIVVVGLGANDGLRGVEPGASEENLRQIVRRSREAGAEVLLLGMLIPPNYGPEYTTRFRKVYPRIANELNVPLVPFVLEGVGGDRRLNQSDGIHPTAQGHTILAENVLRHLRPLVERRAAGEPAANVSPDGAPGG